MARNRFLRAFTALSLAAAACGGGECGPVAASGSGLSVTVTHEDGCGGTTWMAMVTFPDGRTQQLAGDRSGTVSSVMLGDFTGDGAADLVVAIEDGRLFGFAQQAGILFGQELPATMGQGSPAILDGRLRVGSMAWDHTRGVWVEAP